MCSLPSHLYSSAVAVSFLLAACQQAPSDGYDLSSEAVPSADIGTSGPVGEDTIRMLSLEHGGGAPPSADDTGAGGAESYADTPYSSACGPWAAMSEGREAKWIDPVDAALEVSLDVSYLRDDSGTLRYTFRGYSYAIGAYVKIYVDYTFICDNGMWLTQSTLDGYYVFYEAPGVTHVEYYYDAPVLFWPATLAVGDSWTSNFVGESVDYDWVDEFSFSREYVVVSEGTLDTDVGTFETFEVEELGTSSDGLPVVVDTILVAKYIGIVQAEFNFISSVDDVPMILSSFTP